MAIFNLIQRRVLAGLLSFGMVFAYVLPLPVLAASDISDVTKTGNTYNIDANDLKVGQGVNIKLQFNDVDIDVDAKVKEIHGNRATVEFLDLSDEISNELMYEYMKKINAMKNSLSSL